MTDNIIPPTMNDIDIRGFLPPVDRNARSIRVEALPCVAGLEFAEVPNWSFRVVAGVVQKAIAARDEQWRQRLELCAKVFTTCDAQVNSEVPIGTPLYRIKEQS